jgi:hypothetical protein
MRIKSPKEIIEKGNPKTEQAYMKFPRKELIKISKQLDEHPDYVKFDNRLTKEIFKKNNYNKFFAIHTHPYNFQYKGCGIPSSVDLEKFYLDTRAKGEIISQRDTETGDVQGYTILLRGKEKKNIFSRFLSRNQKFKKEEKEIKYNLKEFEEYNNSKEVKKTYNKLNEICKEQDWRLRFVPVKGYYFNKSTGNFEKGSGLEKNLVIGVLFLIFGSLVVLSLPKINGFVFNNSNSITKLNLPFLIGTFLFLCVLFFWIKNLKEKIK